MTRCPNCATEAPETARVCGVCGCLLHIPDEPTRRAAEFVGRQAALQQVVSWLDEGHQRRPFLLLTGAPGVGKSAFLAWLAGAGPEPQSPEMASGRRRLRDSIVALHFCAAIGGGTSQLIDPRYFGQHLARQLTLQDPCYGEAFLDSLRVHLSVHMEVGQAQTVVGPRFGNINVNDPSSLFNCVIEALHQCSSYAPDQARIIIVDALDEAHLWPHRPSIVELLASLQGQELPPNVRFLLTSRPVPDVIDLFPEKLRWDFISDGYEDRGDVFTYARRRIDQLGYSPADELAAKVRESSNGNFLYAKVILDYWSSNPTEMTSANQISLPDGLDGIYTMFLQREYGNEPGRTTWITESRPVLGTVGVAQEKLASKQLRWLLERRADPMRDSLRRCQQYLEGFLPDGPFGLYHQSFRDFLFDPNRNNAFPIAESDWHHYVATRFLAQYGNRWNRCHDVYGLRYIPTHLAMAARLSDQPERNDLTKLLIELILDTTYQKAHQRNLADPHSLQTNLERALEVACLNDHPDAVPLVVESALGLVAYRLLELQPRQIFDLARRGNISEAERRLEHFSPEWHWRQTALLIIAWLGGRAANQAAQNLCDRVSEELLPLGILQLLRDRVDAGLKNIPPPLAPLPSAPPYELALGIIHRMGGVDVNVDPSLIAEFGLEDTDLPGLEMLAELTGEQLASGEQVADLGDATPMFLSERESPFLVAYAVEDPAAGDTLVRQYVSLHAANNYELYRNRSLWGILQAVLGHPDQDWVRDLVADLAVAALQRNRLHFRECLPTALLALEVAAGIPGAESQWRQGLREAWEEASELAPERSAGDSWGAHKRRLGAFAEAGALILDDPTAEDLLLRALELPYGFAGFQSPACLTLAESIAMSAPHRVQDVLAALEAAYESAHNVQDPIFCARTTSRFNALFNNWWVTSDRTQIIDFDTLTIAHRLARDPSAPEFAPIHRIGETYDGRSHGPGTLPLPNWFLEARTLRELADRVYQQPLSEFLRLNRDQGWDATEVIPEGTTVRVPDPEFGALLAARVAAELSRQPGLSSSERVYALQALVSVAASNVTALDTVLARLLTAAHPTDVDDLDRCRTILTSYASKMGGYDETVPRSRGIIRE